MTDTSVADTKAPPSAAAELNVSPPPAPYYEGFANPEAKEWASKSGFKSAEEVAAHARKFDAFKDADPANLALVPAADAKPEAHMAILERLGAPKEASAYALDKIEGVDADLATNAQTWFKEAGLLPWQARMIAEKQMAHAKAAGEKLANEDRVEAEREIASLKTEWSNDYDANREMARRAFRFAGVDKQTIDYLESGLGVSGVLKLGKAFGAFIKEGDFVDGKPNSAEPKGTLERMYPNDVAKDRAARG